MFEYADRTGHELNSVIVDCKYRGETCKGSEFWTTIFTRHGKCLTFNNPADPSKILKTLKGGIDNGLEVLLNLEQEEYIPVWSDNDELSVEAGFKIQLHSQLEPPFLHELACRITCETKQVLAKCGCRMVHMPFLPDEPPRFCQPNKWECADQELDSLTSKDNSKCVCATPCDVRRYSKEISLLKLPSNASVEYLSAKYKKPQNYIRKNFAKLNVFFEALNYEKIEQKKAYEFGALLGDIGGQMGLFIGGSILTLLEIFNYFHDIVKDKTRRRKSSTASTKSVSTNEREFLRFARPVPSIPSCNRHCIVTDIN
ncbi:Oidioi.mRNA.OKI2018_I69.PAR.g11213.t1.cds [Oikopleura dioica]|uniref:Oidioi.mRNA.OKI2018_I69.PAR.g11213.t1.cds n=1 Tax=Oikopleura dioica TaxID=34765 RepID=A0ABN7S218_OIKDI|nr:Oidioi.mRNA.OKI2018_I69.PAR.g11213.t1.cds [Oikopleura dioica]